MSMSKTSAIKAARAAVSAPIRRSSTDYVVYGPWRKDDIDGPTTERTADNYRAAAAMRARWIAKIALGLMGALDSDGYARLAVDSADGGSVEQLVEIGIRANA